jgi:hypothetical protein
MSATGNWTQPGVPHKGWENTGVYDLGPDDRTVCEMCEVQEIRYAHHMHHSEYAEDLVVGCVCAEEMEGDRVGPKRRESSLINAAKRRGRWLNRNWKISAKGNEYIRTDGFVLTVFLNGNRWSGSVIRVFPEQKFFLHRPHPTSEAAKLALFDAMIYLKDRG